MTNQLLYQLAQEAVKRYQDGWRVYDSQSVFFDGKPTATLRNMKTGSMCSEAPEIASYIFALQEIEESGV